MYTVSIPLLDHIAVLSLWIFIFLCWWALIISSFVQPSSVALTDSHWLSLTLWSLAHSSLLGPTETTVWATQFRLKSDAAWRTIGDQMPCGRGLTNYTTLVLGADMQPVAIGQMGELYIGGAGAASHPLQQRLTLTGSTTQH